MSRFEVQRSNITKVSNTIHDLSVYLASLHPDSRCTSSDSARTKSDTSQPSPVPFESTFYTAKPLIARPIILEEIEEEDVSEYMPETKVRYNSQPRKARDFSPAKNNFRHSLARHGNDIMGKYMKMSEKFSEKKNKKDESLYFSNGIFFNIP